MASDKKLIEEQTSRIDQLARALKNARAKAGEITARAGEMTGDMLESAITLAVTGLSAWADGRMDNYKIFGFDASIVIGVPLVLGGVALSLAGMDEIGRWVGAAGLGLVGWYVGKTAYMAGWAGNEKNKGTAPALRGDPARGEPLQLGVIDMGAADRAFARSEPAWRAA